MKNITLLCSYPKSGNTWLRAVITSIGRDGRNVDINNLSTLNAADRAFVNYHLGVNSADMLPHEIIAGRRQLFKYVTPRGKNPQKKLCLKAHDAYLPIGPMELMPFSADAIDAVIYIVRDPRAVALSFSAHLGLSIDETIEVMNNPSFFLAWAAGAQRIQVPHLLSTWSGHVLSWVEGCPFRVHLVRYEDMLADPHNVLDAALTFAGVETSGKTLSRAIRATSFSQLKAQEERKGFRERPQTNSSFFRSGKVDDWKTRLTADQCGRIVAQHEDVMQWLSYI